MHCDKNLSVPPQILVLQHNLLLWELGFHCGKFKGTFFLLFYTFNDKQFSFQVSLGITASIRVTAKHLSRNTRSCLQAFLVGLMVSCCRGKKSVIEGEVEADDSDISDDEYLH